MPTLDSDIVPVLDHADVAVDAGGRSPSLSKHNSPDPVAAGTSYEVVFRDGSTLSVPTVRVEDLHKHLDLEEPVDYPESSYNKPFTQWQMELDDAPIFRYIYRNVRPARHLEFGTWQGTGALYCLEESAATVWTINLPLGESFPDGNPAYTGFPHGSTREEFLRWTSEVNISINGHRTDSFGAVGWQYLHRGLGHRVCQIYCDSTEWDTGNFPAGFFDTVLIDGGHTKDIVINDTLKALPLVRKGGLIMWHDFCAAESFTATVGVMRAIMHLWPLLNKEMSQLFWIYPSWILLGIKR